jgi:hypothetical protein
MAKSNHQQTHQRKRDFVEDPQEKIQGGSKHFDGESCLTATTASLLNVQVVSEIKSKYSNAYKIGMGREKHLNTFADLANTWEQDGLLEWHHQTGDFWGPIFKNFHEDGGWLHIEEIFDTGEEHRFSFKPVTEEESWKRIRHNEVEMEEDPAMLLFREVARVYQRAEPGVQAELNQLFDVHRIGERIEREIRVRETMDEDQAHLNAQVERMLEDGGAAAGVAGGSGGQRLEFGAGERVACLQGASSGAETCTAGSGGSTRPGTESSVGWDESGKAGTLRNVESREV